MREWPKVARRRASRAGKSSTRWKMSYDSEPQLLHEEVSAQPSLWRYVARVQCSLQRQREATACEARESQLLRRYGWYLMLEETRLDTASPTGVKG